MRKIFFGIILFGLAACNNDSDNASSTDTTVNNNSGVENVNGNLPDTTNTITIDGGKPATSLDSSNITDTLPE